MSKAKRVRRSKSKSLPKKARSAEDRKRAEKEVARLASFPELNPNSVVEVDFNANVLYANLATENTFPGLVKLGSNHPFFSNWELVIRALQEEKKNTFGRETRIGEHWYYQQFYLGPKDQSVRIYTMNIDELKKAEDEVRAMSRFPAENPNPVMRISKDGVVMYCNDAGFPILNEWKCQLTQLAPTSWRDLIADAFKSGTKKEFEEEYASRTFSFMLSPIADGGYVNIYGRDVTERKKAEEALKQSEEKYRSLFANMMDGYAYHRTIFDDKGKPVDYVFLEINDAFERLTGLSRAKVIGKRATEVLPGIEKDPADWLGTYGKAVTTRQPIKFENYAAVLQKWYSVSAYSPEEDYLVVTFEDITERKKAEERLAQQALMLASANDAIIGYDLESQITFWNKGAERLYGYSAEEALGKRGYEVLTPTYTGVSREELINRVMSAGHLEAESIRSTRDGRKLNIDTHVILLRDEKGKPIGYLAIDRDITERKQMENALRETKDYLDSLLDYANAPIIVWDPEFKISKFNHAFEHLTGYKTEEVIGKDLSVLFPEESKEESLTKIQRTLTERWEAVEIPIQRKDSDVRTVLWNSANIYATDGKTLMATIAQGQDITERKLAEKALRESEIDLNRAQAVAMTGSWRLNVERNELLWSDETYRMFGIPKGTPLTYETFLSFVHPDDRGHVDEKWKAAMHGEPYDIEHRIVVEGAIKWVREKAELELNKDGVLLSGFGTVQEITEIKEMQAKLQEYSQHLERLVNEKTQKLKEVERMATIGETAGMVGHDIRNPLQSIEGAAYLAKEEIKTLPAESQERKELNEILGIIEHQTNYIDHIVADLQDFARTPMPQPKEVEIQELALESLAMIDIPENVQVQTAFQESLSKLTVDPVFMKRVFANLIENAVQAMPNGGKLTLKVFRDEESTYICVEDTGVGIPEEHKPKMFTPLFSTKSKGQGFGLSVCKKLVEAHKGEITFESRPGNTTFKIKLPLKKNVN